MWVPIKLVVGIILLIPKASGYSIIQVIVMWIVVMGIGIADSTWKAMVTHYGQGGNLISAPPLNAMPDSNAGNVVNLVGNAFRASTCVVALQQELQKRSDKFKQFHPDMVYKSYYLLDTVSAQLQNPTKSTDGKYVVYFPNAIEGMPELRGVCGSIQWDPVSTNNFCDYYAGGEKVGCERYLKENPNALSQLQGSRIEQAIPLALQSLLNSMQNGAWMIASNREALLYPQRLSGRAPNLSITPTSISNSAISVSFGSPLILGTQTFNTIIMPQVKDYTVTFNTAQNTIGSNIQKLIIDQGWMIAGSFANNLLIKHNAVERINLLGRAIPSYVPVNYSQFPGLTDGPSKDIYGISFGSPLNDYIAHAFDKTGYQGPIAKLLVQTMDQNVISPILQKFQDFKQRQWWQIFADQIVSQSDIDKAKNKILDLAAQLGGFLDNVVANLTSILSFGMVNIHILSVLTLVGQILLAGALLIYSLISLAASFFVFAIGLIPTLTASMGAAMLSVFYLPLILAVFGAMIMTGLTLAYYLPLLPLIIFTFGIMGWLVGVIESLIAAPLVALGIMMPESQGNFMGKAGPAIFLLLNLFLRPTLMLFGLIAGLILANISVWIFLLLFLITIMALAGSGLQDIYGLIIGQTDAASVATSIISNVSNILYFLVGFVIFAIILSSTVIAIVKKSFSLIHSVPDRILQWLSGGVQNQLGSEMSGGAEQAGEGMQRSMGSLKETQSEQLRGRYSRFDKASKDKEKALRKDDDELHGDGGRNRPRND